LRSPAGDGAARPAILMCGIAGIVGRLSDSNRSALQRMNACLAHRGPDGEGSWESSPDERGWGVMLTHRRLSIIDLTDAAAQPMVDDASGNAITFNGEIYNYQQLRDRLPPTGRGFQSTGDTAVMLRSLSLSGAESISSFRGMFAFAYWDHDRRKLLLARDPLGIKPLYFARNRSAAGDWSLIFASEIRAILGSGLFGKPRLNPRAAASIVWNGFMVAPETAIEGIETVWPGQFRLFDSSGSEERSEYYWSVPAKQSDSVDEQYLAHALQESVQMHLVSDVPVAVFLSAGVDSTSVANLAQRAARAPVHTFTLAFEEAEFNEGIIARRIAGAIGTDHHEIVLTEQRFMSQLETALDSLDQPTFDGINSFYMSQAVREAGFKVALVGTGGDELFGGYTSFRDLPSLWKWSKHTEWLPQGLTTGTAKLLAAVLQPSRGAIPPQTRWAKLPNMVQRGGDLLSLYQMAYALFLPEFQRQLLGEEAADALIDGLPGAMRSRLVAEVGSRSALAALSVMEERLFLGERLLRDNDSTSMASSIEMRLPLVDHMLFEAVDRLPDSVRYQPVGRKAALRRAGLAGLDPALFERPKTGFVLPYDRWLRTSLGKMIDGTLRDPDAVKPTGLDPDAVQRLWQAFLDGAPGMYWSRVWAIYVYIRWCQKHNAYC
jgi:asparagine synthase (glutamine-hydrolysing)